MHPQFLSPHTRRAFIRNGTLILTGAAVTATLPAAPGTAPALRVGMVTDLHYADRVPAGTRFYRESIAKFQEGVAKFNELKADFAIELGDLIDKADTVELESGYLKTMEETFSKFRGDRHYVLGNHCLATLNREQFREHSASKATYYSFDKGGFHFVVLDACYRADGTAYAAGNYTWTDTEILPAQREWLAADLKATKLKTVGFIHQRLDMGNPYGVKSAPAVREILEQSGKILDVFQGHSHKNDYKEINGVHYVTLCAMVEGSGEDNNAYSLLSFYGDNTLKLEGFRHQSSRALEARKA